MDYRSGTICITGPATCTSYPVCYSQNASPVQYRYRVGATTTEGVNLTHLDPLSIAVGYAACALTLVLLVEGIERMLERKDKRGKE